MEPLHKSPVFRIQGPVPLLDIGDLVGRRTELRTAWKILRDDPHWVSENGRRSGVVIQGIGGIGKSSLAGRLMARLAGEGWIVAATTGAWNLNDITQNLGSALIASGNSQLAKFGDILSNTAIEDKVRIGLIRELLKTLKVCIVFDNFEDNLTIGGDAFNEPLPEAIIQRFLESAGAGKLLFTCRYPIPGTASYVEAIPLGPLSPSQTRKLFMRLPDCLNYGIQTLGFSRMLSINHCLGFASRFFSRLQSAKQPTGFQPVVIELKNQNIEALRLIFETIGGHPRMLEYLDGILRGGRARLPQVTARLSKQMTEAGISKHKKFKDLTEAIRETILIGTCDILLDELLEIVRDNHDEEILYQTAVSRLPIDSAGIANALAEKEPDPETVHQVQAALDRLTALSLITGLTDSHYWVHRWTAESLKGRSQPEIYRNRCRRMGDLLTTLGEGEQARVFYGKDLEITDD